MRDDLEQRRYPEDDRLEKIEERPDRRMTRAEWEAEESAARQAAHKKHQSVRHDREVQEEYDRKHRAKHRDWKKIFLWFGVAAVVLLLIFFLGWLPRHNRAKKAAAESRQRDLEQPEVSVIQVKRTHEPGELTLPGTTAPLTEAFIYARANGYLKRRLVDIGDHVKKGQLLGVIDAPELDAQVAQAREQLRQTEDDLAQQEAQLALKKVTWERWRTLVQKGVFSRQDGDQKEADYLAQVAIVAAAKRNVESYRANLQRVIALQEYEYVRAPFDGVVTQRNADVGALVGASGAASAAPMNSPQMMTGGSSSQASSNNSGTSGSVNMSSQATTGGAQGGPLFAVAQVNVLRILVSVPEGYAQSIQPGMPAAVYLQERVGKAIYGTVTRATASLDQNTRTMLAEVDIDNREGTLLPGMYAITTFTQIRGEAPLTVPGDAIVIRKDRTMLAVVQDNKAQFIPVEIGRDYGPSVEILGGLREGQWVITTVGDGVQNGATVRPQQTDTPGENKGQGGAQTNRIPNAGPNQYGDQSIVNQKTTQTNQTGKPGQSQKGPQQPPSNGKQPKAQAEDKK